MPRAPRPALRLLTPLALALLLTLLGLPRLQQAFTYRVWFRASDPHLQAFDTFQETFGNDDVLACVVTLPEGVFTPRGVEVLGRLTDLLGELPDVEKVSSLATFDWIRDQNDELRVDALLGVDPPGLEARAQIARTHELPRGYLVSEDLKTALVFARLSARPTSEERDAKDYALLLQQAEAALAPLRAEGLELGLAGSAVIPPTLKAISQRDLSRVGVLLLAVLAGVIALLFRSLLAVALTFLVLILTVLVTFGLAGALGIPFNPLTAMVPPILIAIGVADCVHLLSTYRQRIDAGLATRAAAEASLSKNLLPTFLTSLSTALGFFSLALSDLAPIGQLGVLAGLGTMAAWVLSVGILPPVLRRVRLGPAGPEAAPGKEDEGHPQVAPGAFWVQCCALLGRARWPIVVGSALGLVAAIALASRNEVNSDTMEYFADDVPLKQATLRIKEHVGGVAGIDLAIDSGAEDGALEPAFLHKVDALAEWLRAQPKVTKVLSVVDLVKDVRRAWFPEQAEGYRIPDTAPGVAQSLASYTVATPRKNEVDSWMDEDKRRVRLNVLWTLSGSKRVSARVDEVRAKAAELGLDADVTGKTVLMTGMNQAIVSTYFGSILSALALVSLLLVVLLRSLKLGALAMVPNVIAPAVGAALLVLIGQPIDIGTVLVSSVCLGIAVDDTIH
ncbi:MAG TPA: hypothetical protein DEA08_12085, partial [Planctomycetes bacterium]|nr:hypothetical protein [Planctomycetota bacterium]